MTSFFFLFCRKENLEQFYKFLLFSSNFILLFFENVDLIYHHLESNLSIWEMTCFSDGVDRFLNEDASSWSAQRTKGIKDWRRQHHTVQHNHQELLHLLQNWYCRVDHHFMNLLLHIDITARDNERFMKRNCVHVTAT